MIIKLEVKSENTTSNSANKIEGKSPSLELTIGVIKDKPSTQNKFKEKKNRIMT